MDPNGRPWPVMEGWKDGRVEGWEGDTKTMTEVVVVRIGGGPDVTTTRLNRLVRLSLDY
jgi:hypothetical protein